MLNLRFLLFISGCFTRDFCRVSQDTACLTWDFCCVSQDTGCLTWDFCCVTRDALPEISAVWLGIQDVLPEILLCILRQKMCYLSFMLCISGCFTWDFCCTNCISGHRMISLAACWSSIICSSTVEMTSPGSSPSSVSAPDIGPRVHASTSRSSQGRIKVRWATTQSGMDADA